MRRDKLGGEVEIAGAAQLKAAIIAYARAKLDLWFYEKTFWEKTIRF